MRVEKVLCALLAGCAASVLVCSTAAANAWGAVAGPMADASADAGSGGPALAAEALRIPGRGAVGVRISGPPGATVSVAEDGSVLARGTIASGPLVLRDVAAWACRRRERTFVVADATGQSVQVHVRTPSCTTRLRARAPARLRAGAELRVEARDAWATGADLPLRACLAAPAAHERCTPSALQPGAPARVLRWPARRPGRSTLTLAAGGRTYRRSIVVAPPHGRLRVLAAGDSEMQLLDGLIRSGLGARAVVHSDARISTGLTNSFFFDWVAHARAQAASLRPDVTVMFIGANDGFPLPVDGQQIACCGRAWSEAFAGRVEAMARSYARGGAGVVYWYLLPLPRSPAFRRVFVAVNAGYKIAAAALPDDIRLVDATRTFTPHGYRDSMRVGGRTITVHQPDGTHLSYAAMQVASQLLLAAMRRDRVI